MKMIIPIARPATVSVSQVDDEPMKGAASSASAGSSASGTKSKPAFGSAACGSRSACADRTGRAQAASRGLRPAVGSGSTH